MSGLPPVNISGNLPPGYTLPPMAGQVGGSAPSTTLPTPQPMQLGPSMQGYRPASNPFMMPQVSNGGSSPVSIPQPNPMAARFSAGQMPSFATAGGGGIGQLVASNQAHMNAVQAIRDSLAAAMPKFETNN